MRLVFFGTPQIAVKSLKYLIKKQDIEVAAVVTQPDKPAGRGNKLTLSPIKLTAQSQGIEVLQPLSIGKEPKIIERLKELKADIFITFAYGQILPKEVIDIPRLGIINLHASLLPKYRGANPIQRAIVNGDKVTGITTMKTNIGMDTGDILLTHEIPISENMTATELSEKISEISPKIIYKTIIGLDNGSIKPVKQNDNKATKAAKFAKEDGQIDWNESATVIHNKVRGMKPWPSTYTHFKEKMVKIIQTFLLKELSEKPFGEILKINKEGIQVSTKEGIILLTKVQPEGKKEMLASDWANGARAAIGDKFE